MLDAVKYGLTHLWRFDGRDARQTFWYFVLFVYVVTVAITILGMIPAMVRMISGIVDLAKSGAPPEAADQAVAASIGGMFASVGWIGMATSAAMIVLLAASLVRRLHDSGMPGWWALIPGGLQLVGIAMLPSQLEKMAAMMRDIGRTAMTDPMASYRAQGPASLVGWAAIAAVIWFGVRKSTPGPNRYGETPVSF